MARAPSITRSAPTREVASTSSRAERIAGWCLPSLGDLLFVLVLGGGALVFQGALLGTDGDAGWNIRLGTLTLDHGLPRTEPLLATMRGQPTVHWEWLAQVGYGLANRVGGLNGVVALAALLVAVTAAGLYAILRARRLPALVAFALALVGLALVSTAWTARAELFSLPLTLWWCEWLRRYWRDGKAWRLAGFPLATLLWANLHAGFVVALGLLAAATALAWLRPTARGAARPWPLTIALGAALLATLATPWGLALPEHLLAFARDPLVAAHTREYQPPSLGAWPLWLLLALLVVLGGAWVALWRRARRDAAFVYRLPWLDLMLVGLWTVLALRYVRFLPFWPLVALPPLAEALACWWWPRTADGHGSGWVGAVRRRVAGFERLERQVGRGVWSGAACLALVVLVVRGGNIPGTGAHPLHAEFDARAFPVAAVARLRAGGVPAGRGFNPYDWGGYLDYALPEMGVFIDSRSDVYGEPLLRDYLAIVGLAPGWQRTLARYQIAWALLPAHAPLAQALARQSGWECQPVDGQGVAVLCEPRAST